MTRRRAPLPPVEAEYPYALPDGRVVGYFRRHVGKVFRWQRVDERTGQRVSGQPKPCPLFLAPAPALAPAVAAGVEIHLAEGEKDALAIAAAGAVATSIPNGVTVTQTGTETIGVRPRRPHVRAFGGRSV